MSKDTTGKSFDLNLFSRILKYTRPYKLTFTAVALAAIMLSFFSTVRPVILRYTVNDYILGKDAEGLLFFVLLMTASLFLEVISQLSFIYFANWLGQSVVRDIRIRLFNHMVRFRMKYFDSSSVGILVTRAVSDVERIAAIFSDGLFMIISDLLKMLVVAGVMLYYNWKLSLIIFAVLPLMLYATRIFQKAMKKAFIEVRKEVANLNSFVQERLTGMKIVHLFVREKKEYDSFVKINEKHKTAWINTVWYNSIFIAVVELMSAVTTGLIVWYGGLQAVLQNDVSKLGDVFMFIMLASMIFRPLRQIADKFNTLQMGMVAANRVFDVLDTNSRVEETGDQVAGHFKGDLEFENVRFEYVEGEEVLRGISFSATAGQTVAIVGATGAGKSTIINLLNRFYDIKSGSIRIDGEDIRNFTVHSLRNQIAIVLQDVFLFADSIFHNITLRDPQITEEEVVAAAKEIGIHEFISSLPGGYHYNVKERGSMLSSGQRQLIAFLRAYVSNPSILVLDEATSSVDGHSERLMQQATERVTKGRTSIVIAHRLATVKKADKILVMEAGQIVEEGTHDELLQRENGKYRKLYEVQFMAEEEEAL